MSRHTGDEQIATDGSPQAQRVDWSVPPGKPDWLFGTGATPIERGLVWATVAVGAVATGLLAWRLDIGWVWWQWLIVAILIVDIVGGVTANSLGTAKRLYATAPVRGGGLVQRFALDHVLFTAAHVHLFVVVAAFGGEDWVWAAYWYVVSLGSVVITRRVPVYLQRPIALGLTAVALIGGQAVAGPVGLGWLGPVLMLKLLVAHAVTESPFRPSA